MVNFTDLGNANKNKIVNDIWCYTKALCDSDFWCSNIKISGVIDQSCKIRLFTDTNGKISNFSNINNK